MYSILFYLLKILNLNTNSPPNSRRSISSEEKNKTPETKRPLKSRSLIVFRDAIVQSVRKLRRTVSGKATQSVCYITRLLHVSRVDKTDGAGGTCGAIESEADGNDEAMSEAVARNRTGAGGMAERRMSLEISTPDA